MLFIKFLVISPALFGAYVPTIKTELFQCSAGTGISTLIQNTLNESTSWPLPFLPGQETRLVFYH